MAEALGLLLPAVGVLVALVLLLSAPVLLVVGVRRWWRGLRPEVRRGVKAGAAAGLLLAGADRRR